ncbi:MAG: Hpt domain-containing protein [Gammaproteobacteria bacterium]|nr:Hpt domain-containing protein [Gammaproteobacteria bacterium]
MAVDMSRFIARFVDEAREHLTQLNQGIAHVDNATLAGEPLNALFRSAHTIKGSSRMLKLTTISDTAHQLEDLLGALREGKLSPTPPLARLMERSIDTLSVLVDLAANQQPLPPPDSELSEAIHHFLQPSAPAAETAATATTTSTATPEEQPAVTTAAPASATPVPATAAPTEIKSADTVRVRLNKLDELIQLMGEMVASHARQRQRQQEIYHFDRQLQQLASADNNPALQQLSETLHPLARNFRDDVTGQELLLQALSQKALMLRMLPLAMVFDATARVVRDLARSIGKEVQCKISGSEIELDRQIIDRLGDPLLHLLRNAIDHGIETPEERQARGKAAHGEITISARQEGSLVIISVADNGAGLDHEKIRAKALHKGLITPELADKLSESDLLDLIFMPGFSTSAIISEISGRGVGLDVVRHFSSCRRLMSAPEQAAVLGHLR